VTEASARRGLFFVLSGPAGVGKNSVMNRLREHEPDVHFAVTATTRDPRPGEREGVDYYFKSQAALRGLLERGELLEHATVHGRLYGVPLDPIREALGRGADVFVQVDVQGMRTIRRRIPAAVTLFLYVPKLEDLADRLQQRATESPDELARRLATAVDEIDQLAEFDYAVPNPQGELEQAVADVQAIIRAERRRARPRLAEIDPDDRA
jgi:guanylate kinase